MPLSTDLTAPFPPPRSLRWPIVLTVALVLAVFLTPFPLAAAWLHSGHSDRGYSDLTVLVDSLSTAFVHHWKADSGAIGADLAVPVDFWARFHIVKAALAAALLVVMAPLGSRTWALYLRAGTTANRILAGALLALEALIAVIALLVVVANTQGAIAPLSSALGLLPVGTREPVLAQAVTQIREGLAAGAQNPALTLLVDDFTAYHLAMAGLGVVVTVALLIGAVTLWRRRSRLTAGSQRGRHLLAVGVAATVTLSLFFAVVTAGNVSTVVHPAPALLGFFEGGV